MFFFQEFQSILLKVFHLLASIEMEEKTALSHERSADALVFYEKNVLPPPPFNRRESPSPPFASLSCVPENNALFSLLGYEHNVTHYYKMNIFLFLKFNLHF